MNSAIRTENLTKRFWHVKALSQMNLDVPASAIYALVGPNGAGKTTAIKMLMNIIRPTQGSAYVLGKKSTELRGRFFATVGYVSENQDLLDWMTVGGFLAYLRPFYPTWDHELEHELIRQFDLPINRKLKHLSRGMRMKAALAGSLAYHPKLIVLDEPFGGLDPLVRDQLIEGMLERASEATILISSHDLAEIESFASHIGFLDQGQLRFSEEMGALSKRFREAELVFDSSVTIPATVPESWIKVGNTPTVVRFVESDFDPERTPAEIRNVFPSVREIAFTPMSLRSIFLAVAKNNKATAARAN